MAYVAWTGTATRSATAGSKSINLLAELKKFQDMSDGPNKGAFSVDPRHHELRHPLDRAGRSSPCTTSWTISHSDCDFVAAETWLATQQNDLGQRRRRVLQQREGRGLRRRRHRAGLSRRSPSARIGTDWDRPRASARTFLQGRTRTTSADSRTSARTAARRPRRRPPAIQAIIARGEHPEEPTGGTAIEDADHRPPPPAPDQRLVQADRSARTWIGSDELGAGRTRT